MKNLLTYLKSKTFENFCKRRNVIVIVDEDIVKSNEEYEGLAAMVYLHIDNVERYNGVFTDDDQQMFELHYGKYNGDFILKYKCSYQFPNLENGDLLEVDDFPEIKEIVKEFIKLKNQEVTDYYRRKEGK